MLRISAILEPLNHGITLRLEGRLVDRWVKELDASCSAALSNGGRLMLDLMGVSFIDPSGLALLRSLDSPNVSLINASPFVTQQLKGVGLCSS